MQVTSRSLTVHYDAIRRRLINPPNAWVPPPMPPVPIEPKAPSLKTEPPAHPDAVFGPVVCRRPPQPDRITIDGIQIAVAHMMQVSRADILSQRRTANVVRPRQIAMYLAKMMTPHSLPVIGRKFGGRDHTTVLHAVRKIDGLIADDHELAEQVATIRRAISN